jgi:hypothetical protein
MLPEFQALQGVNHVGERQSAEGYRQERKFKAAD